MVVNLIKKALITLRRTGIFGQSKYMDTTSRYESIHPYGFYSRALPNSLVMIVNMNRDESHKLGVEYNNKSIDVIGQKLDPGESGIYNPTSNCFITFKNDGTINVQSEKDLNIDVPDNTNLNTTNLTITASSKTKVDTATLDVDVSGAATVDASTLKVTSTTTHIGPITQTGVVTITGNVNVTGNITATGIITGSAIAASGGGAITGGSANLTGNMTSASATINSKDFDTHTHSAGSYVDGMSSAVTGNSGTVN